MPITMPFSTLIEFVETNQTYNYSSNKTVQRALLLDKLIHY